MLERKIEGGDWVAVSSGVNSLNLFTLDTDIMIDGMGFEHRLTMSDYTSDFYYEIHAGT